MVFSFGISMLLLAGWMFLKNTFPSKPLNSPDLNLLNRVQLSRKSDRKTKDAISGQANGHTSKDAVLKHLKNRWNGLIEKPENSEDANSLVDESIRILQCSDDQVELCKYLRTNGRLHTADRIMEGVKILFASERAPEARAALISMSGNGNDFGSSASWKRLWSYDAGLGCPVEEFDTFVSRLDPISARNAVYGQSMAAASTDPIGALKAALGVYPLSGKDERIDGGAIGQSEQVLAWIIAKATDSKLEELLTLLPSGVPAESAGFKNAYCLAVKRIARSDMGAATAYVLNNAGRVPPEAMANLADGRQIDEVSAWATGLPRGVFYDAAVQRLVNNNLPSLHQSEDALQPDSSSEAIEQVTSKLEKLMMLANQVSDPGMRSSVVETINDRVKETLSYRR